MVRKGYHQGMLFLVFLFLHWLIFELQANNVEVLPGGLAGIPGGLAKMEANQVSSLKLVARPHETAA